MQNMIDAAREQVSALTQSAYEKAAAGGVLPAGVEVRAQVDRPKDANHGDYATSFAMAAAKAMGKAPPGHCPGSAGPHGPGGELF